MRESKCGPGVGNGLVSGTGPLSWDLQSYETYEKINKFDPPPPPEKIRKQSNSSSKNKCSIETPYVTYAPPHLKPYMDGMHSCLKDGES